jgi:hypothetical protein
MASQVATDGHYTQAQLKQMARDAQTPEQYRVLAGYYLNRRDTFLRQAAEEKQELARRSQNVMVVAAKYPRPVDSSRYRYEYFTYEAGEAQKLAEKFRQLAAPAAVSK